MVKSFKLYAAIAVAVLVAAGASWYFSSQGVTSANAAMAEYQIDKLTCGACVGNIKSALSDIDGVSNVDVNLTSNRGRVFFNPAEVDSAEIAATITAAGYPAKLRLEMSPDEYIAYQQEQEMLGQEYMARIGDRLLSRADFETQVAQRAGGVAGNVQNDQLVKTTWQELLQRELLLAAAEENQIIIQDGEVDLRLEELREQHKGLDELVAKRYGGMESFRARIKDDMIINRNIEEHVYAGTTDPRERQAKLQAWFAQLQGSTEVTIFDPQLKAISQGNAGCACCNS